MHKPRSEQCALSRIHLPRIPLHLNVLCYCSCCFSMFLPSLLSNCKSNIIFLITTNKDKKYLIVNTTYSDSSSSSSNGIKPFIHIYDKKTTHLFYNSNLFTTFALYYMKSENYPDSYRLCNYKQKTRHHESQRTNYPTN